MKNRQPRKWVYVGWMILGFSLLLSGVTSGNVVTMILGTAVAFAFWSGLLMYIKSEHRVKRALEVISTLVTLGVIVYGYAITRSLILGVITLFIFAMVFIAFTLSYLLPRIRNKSYG